MKKAFLGLFTALMFLTGCSFTNNENDPGESIENKGNDSVVKEEEKKADPDFVLESHFFNEVELVDGKAVIQNPDNILVLVNKEYSLPSNYTPEDLTMPNVPFSFGDLDIPKRYMRKEAAEALEGMFETAKEEGIILYGVSAFRPYEYQVSLFNNEVEQKGEEHAIQAVAQPGQSEHQTGLTIDVSSESVGYQITEQFGETKEGIWLKEHAHEFGFIIRYPKGKEDITLYQYEPWHIRYVGEKVAKVLFENDLTLEEYFGKVKKI
ncbi:M15 family metallopeptidase [Bacillus sp. FJAT-47783]|uniref:M15 family metallopeptidase n=1 Tax=Bacillus sp. FJAT-47783 TaxID=2922712 RepID=UPI001FAC0C67|nr:M15 family metallopeptidase [Bacillus sp. FJAT-47783]